MAVPRLGLQARAAFELVFVQKNLSHLISIIQFKVYVFTTGTALDTDELAPQALVWVRLWHTPENVSDEDLNLVVSVALHCHPSSTAASSPTKPG